MKERIKCPSCGADMKFIHRKKDGIGYSGKYRIRKFICLVCGHEDIVTAAGERDINRNKNFDAIPKQECELFEFPAADEIEDNWDETVKPLLNNSKNDNHNPDQPLPDS